jgi:hypothetical protein
MKVSDKNSALVRTDSDSDSDIITVDYAEEDGDYLARQLLAQVSKVKNRKEIPVQLINKAGSNRPLSFVYTQFDRSTSNPHFEIQRLMETCLNTHFKYFKSGGINFDSSVEEICEYGNESILTDAFSRHTGCLKTCFIGFKTIFDFVTFLLQNDKFQEKHMQSVHSCITSFNVINDVQRAAPMLEAITTLLEFNKARHIYEMPVVLPNQELCSVLLAMPVWFSGKGDLSFVYNLVSSQSFSTLFQMYNMRIRPIEEFPTLPDPMPTHCSDFYKHHAVLFDNYVVTTPYHNLASGDWASVKWINNVDPWAIGLWSNIPFCLVTHEWSGDGLLRHILPMIGDTISHLKENKRALSQIEPRISWHNGFNPKTPKTLGNKKALGRFTFDLIHAFENDRVFDFLQGKDTGTPFSKVMRFLG